VSAVTTAVLVDWARRFGDAVAADRDRLTALDQAVGDGDHGTNMARGMTAVLGRLETEPADAAEFGKTVGMTLVSTVGGASGPLYGTFFLRFGASAGRSDLDAAGLGAALRAGLEGVRQRGKAEPGDKTMLDAMVPALDAFDAAGGDVVAATEAAAAAAARGRDATEPLVARKGRASYLGERSAGHLDPGATSTAMLFRALADAAAAA
jgi:phosphoenolpyruvate---glycerone phosphotransferase subunit DhaL